MINLILSVFLNFLLSILIAMENYSFVLFRFTFLKRYKGSLFSSLIFDRLQLDRLTLLFYFLNPCSKTFLFIDKSLTIFRLLFIQGALDGLYKSFLIFRTHIKDRLIEKCFIHFDVYFIWLSDFLKLFIKKM